MRMLLPQLAAYTWIDGFTAFAVVPLVLTILTALILWACSDIRLSRRKLCVCFVFFLVLRVLHEGVVAYGMSVSTAYRMGFTVLLWLYLLPRGLRRPLTLLHILAVYFVNDLITSLFLAALYPPDFAIPGTWAGTTLLSIPYALLPMLLSTALFSFLYHAARKRKWINTNFAFYAFAAIAAGVAIALPHLPLSNFFGPTTPVYTTDLALVLSLVISGLLLFMVVYFSSVHFQHRSQVKKNRSLQQQEHTYASLVADQRAYRHNLMNMLYGFEAPILSGDMEKIHAYYCAMVRKNYVINNENIIAVQNIHSSAVRGLLLAHMQQTQARELPFHLACAPLAAWCRIGDADCCALVGALLDNAEEAAAHAQSPFVSMTVCNAEDCLEIVIRNTFGPLPDMDAMQAEGYTTKAHEGGVGLDFARSLLQKHEKAQYHLFLQGQYIVQQLLLP